MAMTNARRGGMVLGLAVAAGIAWLSWAWSPTPAAEEEPMSNDAGEEAPLPVPVAQPMAAAPVAQPAKAAPAQKPDAPDAALLPHPERIPTPHAMSLDQTKPPEQYGALAELRQQYASESRSASSSATESKLREMLATPNIPSELVQDISCRRAMCKLEVQWTPRRRLGFVVVLESFKQLYGQRVAVEPAAAPSTDGTYLTTLYMRLTP